MKRASVAGGDRGRALVAGGVAAALVFAAGCGDDTEAGTGGGSAGGGGPTSGATTAASTSAASTTAASTTGSGGGGGAGGAGGSGGVPEEITAACVAYNEAFCERLFACEIESFPEYLFADEADCVEARVAVCESAYRPDGATAEDGEACAATIESFTCTEFLAFGANGFAWADFPSECLFQGDRAEGEACELGAQCASGFCDDYAGSDSLCGVCVSQLAEGDPCSQVCGIGLACLAGTCTPLGDVGDDCDAGVPCLYGLWCDAGVCTDVFLEDGDTCELDNIGCSFDVPVCNSVTTTCEAPSPAGDVGDPCWVAEDGSLALCLNSLCQVNLGTGIGTCIAPKQHGEVCSAANNIVGRGDDCDFELSCFAGSCQYPGEILVCE